jgi:hypothetical protein
MFLVVTPIPSLGQISVGEIATEESIDIKSINQHDLLSPNMAATTTPSFARISGPQPLRKVVLPVAKSDAVALPKGKEISKAPVLNRVVTPLIRPTPVSSAPSENVADSLSSKPVLSKHVPSKSKEQDIPLATQSGTVELDNISNVKSVLQADPSSVHKPTIPPSQRLKSGILRVTTPVTKKDNVVEVSAPSSEVKGTDLPAIPPQSAVNMASSGSQPATPSTADLSVRRNVQPRTLRITDTPKTETPPPIVPSPSITVAPTQASVGSKIGSRRPSLTSTAQPGTPLSERIDLSSLASASRTASRVGSRATSPTPIVGKKRGEKTKAKKHLLKKREEEEVLPPPVLEEQSPILGRKKKTRKPGPLLVTSASRVTSVGGSKPTTPSEEKSPVIENKEIYEAEPSRKKGEEPSLSIQDDPLEIPAPKPQKPANIFASFFSNADQLLNHPLTHTLNNNSHIRNLPDRNPFAEPADFENYIKDIWAHVPHDHPLSDPFTSEESNAYITSARAAHQPVRLKARNGRLSGAFLVTTSGTCLLGLTPAEEERMLALEDSIAASTGTTFWGSGDPAYLPDIPEVRAHNHRAADVRGRRVARGTVMLDGKSEITAREPPGLVNEMLFGISLERDPRVSAPATTTSVASPPPAPLSSSEMPPQQQQQQPFPLSSQGTMTRASMPSPVDLMPLLQPARDPATAAMFDKLERVAGDAKQAAALIGGTRDILMRKIRGTEGEALEAERRAVAEREKKLNAVIRRNRKLIGGKV